MYAHVSAMRNRVVSSRWYNFNFFWLVLPFSEYNRKEVYDLNGEICNVLVKCSTLNLGVLFTVVRLLHRYVTKWYPSSHVDQVPEMFAKLLLENIEAESGVEIVTTLVHNFREIFNER